MPSDEAMFPGYTLVFVICEAAYFAVCHAISQDHEHFLLKVPISSRPPAAAIAQLAHEYEAARELDPAFAVRTLQLRRDAGAIALILENFCCYALVRDLVAPLVLDRFFRVAAPATGALAALHRQGAVHKDIKPENTFLASSSDGTIQAKFTGFGATSRRSRERQRPYPPEAIAGMPAYMVPRQTGRMNCPVDSRSDLYSLWGTICEMFTGRLPFTASDALEWGHCHIAIQPTRPGQYRADIPEPLSEVVMKLLAKNAGNRYQAAGGLAADLERCVSGSRVEGHVAPFPVGARDVTNRLLIPAKRYGCEREVETLLAASARDATSGKPELVLVSGYSGISKSAVLNGLFKALVPQRALGARLGLRHSTWLGGGSGLHASPAAIPRKNLSRWEESSVE
jgi:serine/threonine protein kinase